MAGHGLILEPADRPLRRSALWDLQARYYEDCGTQSWDTGAVPNWITSNGFIANAFASAILYGIRDLVDAGRIDPSQPVYILELGAGTGKLAFLVLRRILDRISVAKIGRHQVKYIMSDFSTSPFEAWLSNPALEPLIADGYLDFGLFDCHTSTSIPLWHAKKQLKRGDIRNPLFVIGNYLFDSLRQDAFKVVGTVRGGTAADATQEGRAQVHIAAAVNKVGGAAAGSGACDCQPASVFEGRLLLRSQRTEEPDVSSGEILSRMDNSWVYHGPIDEPGWYYSDSQASGPSATTEVAAGTGESNAAHANNSGGGDVIGDTAAAHSLNAMLCWYAKHALACQQTVPKLDESASGASDAWSADASASSWKPWTACPRRTISTPSAADESDDTSSDDGDNCTDAGSVASSAAVALAAASSSTFLLPVGGITCLHRLKDLAGDTAGVVILMADKGFSEPYHFTGASDPEIHVHGSMSMMVNFHAMGLWAEMNGGQMLVSKDDDVHLKTAIMALLPLKKAGRSNEAALASHAPFSIQHEMPLLVDVFKEQLERFGPAEFWDVAKVFDTASTGNASSSSARRPEAQSQLQRLHAFGSVGSDGARVRACAPTTSRARDFSGAAGERGDRHSAVAADAATRPPSRSPQWYDSDVDEDDDEEEDVGVVAGGTVDDDVDGAANQSRSRPKHGPSPSPARVSLRAAVALCRLSCWDPDVYYPFRHFFASRLPSLSIPRRAQVLDGLQSMWERWYPSKGSMMEYDVPFEIGRLLYLTGGYKAALPFYLQSLNFMGQHKSTLFMIGMCCYHLKQYSHAKDWLQKAIDAAAGDDDALGGAAGSAPSDDGYPAARRWMDACDEEIRAEQGLSCVCFAPRTTASSPGTSVAAVESSGTSPAAVSAQAPPPQQQQQAQPDMRRLVLPGMRNVKLYI